MAKRGKAANGSARSSTCGGGETVRIVRVFVSSPNDVTAER